MVFALHQYELAISRKSECVGGTLSLDLCPRDAVGSRQCVDSGPEECQAGLSPVAQMV